MEADLNKAKRVHFIGIGGIGISAISRMMLLEGREVSGSDMASSLITKELEVLGARVAIGHKRENVPEDADLVIYTVAVSAENPEREAAKDLGIPTITYPEALNLITKDKYTIAVSGTHGKTTTTAMIAEITRDAGLDPTVIVGSIMKGMDSNFIAGKSKYFVVEACEFKRSFLNLNPNILVITNIDNDHLDYYKDIEDIKSAFRELVEKVPEDGFVICNLSQLHIADVTKDLKCKVVDYEIFTHQRAALKAPGEHNRQNAAAARAVAEKLNIKTEDSLEALSHFAGTWRRFEYRGKTQDGAILFDDYAHHPTEIKATLAGARQAYPDKRVTVIFQPHLYSRTKLLLRELAESFKDADRVFVLPIYAAREAPDPSISSELLVGGMSEHPGAFCVSSEKEALNRLKSDISSGDLIITMGAGDVYALIDKLL